MIMYYVNMQYRSIYVNDMKNLFTIRFIKLVDNRIVRYSHYYSIIL